MTFSGAGNSFKLKRFPFECLSLPRISSLLFLFLFSAGGLLLVKHTKYQRAKEPKNYSRYTVNYLKFCLWVKFYFWIFPRFSFCYCMHGKCILCLKSIYFRGIELPNVLPNFLSHGHPQCLRWLDTLNKWKKLEKTWNNFFYLLLLHFQNRFFKNENSTFESLSL